MALRPVDKRTGRPRPMTDDEKAIAKRQQEKKDYYRRNPHIPWGK